MDFSVITGRPRARCLEAEPNRRSVIREDQDGVQVRPPGALVMVGKVHASMKPLQARTRPWVRLSDGDELSKVAGGQGG